MIPKKILIFLLVFYGCVNALPKHKDCSSCMMVHQCPEAMSLLGNKNIRAMGNTKKKIEEAFCGIEVKNGKRFFKICCSDFIILRHSIEDVEPEEDRNEMHRNIALLPETCGRIEADRLLGSNFASVYEFPWMTLIAYVTGLHNGTKRHEFKCVGTVIHSKYILTAAHCVKDKKIAGVRIGDFDINSKVDCLGEYPYHICENHLQDIAVKKGIIHEDYHTQPYVQNDIALLRLKNPIDFSFKNAAPVCLPIYDGLRNMTIGGKSAIVAGWGLTEDNRASSILRKVNLQIKTDIECQEYYENFRNLEANSNIIDKKICASKQWTGDSCNGDPGSPLMLEDEYKDLYRMIQFGVESLGPQQCGSATPEVYTDVRKYVKWILDNIEE